MNEMAQNNGHSVSTGAESKVWTTTTAHGPTVAQRLLGITAQPLHKENTKSKMASQSNNPGATKSQGSLNTQKVEKICAEPGSKYVPPHRNPANYWSHPNYKVPGGITTTFPFRVLPRRNTWMKCPAGTEIPSDADSNWRRH